jgi:hypothetical protein
MSDFFATIKDIAPWVAIVFSSLALYVSILNYRRDRAILVATSHFYQAHEHSPASLSIKIVNAGRRPIILSTWVGAESKQGRWGRRKVVAAVGSFFDSTHGLTLGERQRHRFTLEAEELISSVGDGEIIEIDDIWIEDTLGHKHKVKDVRENIAKLNNWKWPVRKAGERSTKRKRCMNGAQTRKRKKDQEASPPSPLISFNIFGRGEKIRTSDPLHPMQVRYQAALRPDEVGIITEHFALLYPTRVVSTPSPAPLVAPQTLPIQPRQAHF